MARNSELIRKRLIDPIAPHSSLFLELQYGGYQAYFDLGMVWAYATRLRITVTMWTPLALGVPKKNDAYNRFCTVCLLPRES
jgi:hypothetical protein